MWGLAAGFHISVSPAENLGYLLGATEPHLQKAIRRYVSPGDTVYDVGANIGYVSLSLAKRVGVHGQVVSFEPLPQNLESLKNNIDINELANVRVMEVAASTGAGDAIMRVAENLATASLVWHRNVTTAREIIVKTVSIDELVEKGAFGLPRFVKIDVEGSEGEVLQGMRRTIATAKPVLFVECSDAGREVAWHLLSELGYRCQLASSGAPIDDLKDYRHSDFLWLP